MKPIKFIKKDGVIPNEPWFYNEVAKGLLLLKNGQHTFVFDKLERNIDQNALMWMWFGCLSESGSEPSEFYEYYCKTFLPERCLFDINGNFKRGQTSTLKTNEFAEFLNKIQADAAQQGITLPSKNDKNFDSFKNEYQRFIRH